MRALEHKITKHKTWNPKKIKLLQKLVIENTFSSVSYVFNKGLVKFLFGGNPCKKELT